MVKKIIIISLLIAVVGISYFAFSVFTEREQDLITPHEEESDVNSTSPLNAPPPNIQKDESLENATDIKDLSGEQTDNSVTNDPENTFYINVTPPDCMRECEPYQYDPKELEYCKNVCGLSSPDTRNCDILSGLEKDYCIKDTAIEEKDMTMCDDIEDAKIKETCKNRIQEDILENM